MQHNYDRCLKLILEHEGGYVDHPKDPGGATNMGITLKTLEAWLGREVTKQEVKDLDLDVVKAIYKDRYWNKIKGDDLPSGVDLMVFDFAVNSGTHRAAKFLQRAVGAQSDGLIGPKTLKKVSKQDPSELIKKLTIRRDKFYRSLSTFDTFGTGWMRRLESTTKHAHDMRENGNG